MRFWVYVVATGWATLGLFSSLTAEPAPGSAAAEAKPEAVAAILTCHDMIDDGLFQSIKRRSQEAIDRGADYLILDVQTYGGWVKSADDIGKYLILELGDRIHTVAYVSTEAISAGSMISVSCKDIIMRQNTTIGCSAPITGGGAEMGETEREKSESFVRATFSRAAEANGYPEALLKAMVSRDLEVWQVPYREGGAMAYFETDFLPDDPNTFALDQKTLVVKQGELLTLTAQKALDYGIARAVVADIDEALTFLAARDGVTFAPEVIRLETLWSEEMVRWLKSPMVMGILVMGMLLGAYVEFNTPGLGAPALLALVCLVILVGSRYLIGMANWVEIAILGLGCALILVEIFVIPGFGVAGVAGIICLLVGMLGLLVRNAPGELPWPRGPQAWTLFTDGLFGMALGFIGFLVVAIVLARYLHRMPLLNRFVLESTLAATVLPASATGGAVAPQPGQIGTVISPLRPAGKARFDTGIVDVVADGAFIETGRPVKVLHVHGNVVQVTATEPA